jgi:hypothetical protein
LSVAPKARLELGSLAYDSHLTAVSVTLATLPGVTSFRATLPGSVEVDASVGDRVKLELDGGEGAETVVTGRLRALRRTQLGVEAIGADGSADLCALRPAATYERQKAGDIIGALAAEVGVGVGSLDVGLQVAAYVADQSRSAGEHAAYLARLAGCTLVLDGDGLLGSRARSSDEPDAALRHGRELIAYEVSEWAPPSAELVAIGSGPAGSASAPNALRVSVGRLPDDAPTPGADAVWEAHAVLRTPGAASDASAAIGGEASAGATRLRARAFLLPALRPGAIVDVQELPEPLSGGPWAVARVRHELRGDGSAETVFEGISAGTGGTGGLLALIGSVL